MSNFYETVLNVLKKDSRFFTDEGELLRNAVYEAAMKMDADLIKLLLEMNQQKSVSLQTLMAFLCLIRLASVG